MANVEAAWRGVGRAVLRFQVCLKIPLYSWPVWPFALVKLVKLWKFSYPFPAITGNHLGPLVTGIDKCLEIAFFRFSKIQKSTHRQRLPPFFFVVLFYFCFFFTYSRVAVACKVSQYSPFAATNKGSCQSKLYRRRFTSIHPRAPRTHTHHTTAHPCTHTHTHASRVTTGLITSRGAAS